MTMDEIIKLAKEAGPLIRTPFDEWCRLFAALVAAKEREECALICDEHWRHSGTAQECADAIRARGQAEREACAKVADHSPRYPMVLYRNNRICCEGDCPYYGQPRPTSCACSRP